MLWVSFPRNQLLPSTLKLVKRLRPILKTSVLAMNNFGLLQKALGSMQIHMLPILNHLEHSMIHKHLPIRSKQICRRD